MVGSAGRNGRRALPPPISFQMANPRGSRQSGLVGLSKRDPSAWPARLMTGGLRRQWGRVPGGVPLVGGTALPSLPPLGTSPSQQQAASSSRPAHALQQPLQQKQHRFPPRLGSGLLSHLTSVHPTLLTRLSVSSHPVGQTAAVHASHHASLCRRPVGGDRLRRCDGSGPPAVLCCSVACLLQTAAAHHQRALRFSLTEATHGRKGGPKSRPTSQPGGPSAANGERLGLRQGGRGEGAVDHLPPQNDWPAKLETRRRQRASESRGKDRTRQAGQVGHFPIR